MGRAMSGAGPETSHATDAERATQRAWVRFLGSMTALAMLAVALPTPLALLADLSGSAGPAMIEAAVLTSAALVVWGLLIWGTVVGTIAVLARAPGAVGRMARGTLRAIAPAAAGRLVAAVVGVSMVTGASACAAPLAAADPAAPPSAASTMDTVDSASAFDIDWPTTAAAAASDPVDPDESATSPATTDSPPPAAPGASGPPTSASTSRDARSATTPVPPPASGVTSPGSPLATAQPVPTHQPVRPVPPDQPLPSDQQPPVGSQTDTTSTARSAAADPAGATVTVRPGDTLWAIAERHLGPQADAAQIDTAWRHWHSANAAAIGSDPDLIVPGQRLSPPVSDKEQ